MSAIRVEGLGKQYVVAGRGRAPESFREALVRGASAPLRWLGSLRAGRLEEHRFWALRDVSFAIHPGEVIGVIGRNGAGKTTLLKILSRITAPTRGRIEIRGRLGSLLEVGTGFHPDLTGRENIYLNGAILGMKRAEIRRKFDEIVAFAEVERFLHAPVKQYSTGMAVRLAFSIAAHLEPEILLVDEVLAVGDLRFQRKCLGKMDAVSREGRTVFFVSHSLSAVSKLCSKAMVLNEGRLLTLTGVADAIRAYTELVGGGAWKLSRDQFSGPLTGKVEFDRVSINEESKEGLQIRPSQPAVIRVAGVASEQIPGYRTTVSIFREGQTVISRHDAVEPGMLPRGPFESEVVIPPYFLSPGEYWVTFGGYTVETGAWTWSKIQLSFIVLEEWSPQYDTTANMGLVNLTDPGRRFQA